MFPCNFFRACCKSGRERCSGSNIFLLHAATPKLRFIEKRLGEAGYGRFFKVLEIVAERGGIGANFDPQVDLKLPHTDLQWLAEELGISVQETKKTFKVFVEAGLISVEAWRQGILYIPKMNKYKDEWARKNSRQNYGAAPESLRSNSLQRQIQNGKREQETDVDSGHQSNPSPTNGQEAARELWAETQKILRENTNRHTFDTWYSPTRGLFIRDETLYVEVPNAMFQHWLSTDGTEAVMKALDGCRIKVNYIVAGQPCKELSHS